MTLIARTPVGDLYKGDLVWWLKADGKFAVAVATGRSTTTPNLIFARTKRGKARCVPIPEIRRIQPKENPDA